MGIPFRSVVKTFQVVTWRELGEQWRALDGTGRQQLKEAFPLLGQVAFAEKRVSEETGEA